MLSNPSGQSVPAAVSAQAECHQHYLIGLQLAVAMREGPQVMEEWMFRLFRSQHLQKFLSSFRKLGLEELPHAVACARYHVLSNGIGGVPVEYIEESDTRAWVRFRYPRWMYDGPALCGIPVEVSRGFLRGWYAYNGVSLGNPRLGFVCVSEDMTGQFGLCGYFREHDRDLAEHERLVFSPNERPPPTNPAAQPGLPAAEWNAERLAKAKRNYAVDYIRNGIRELAGVIGSDRALLHAKSAARLTGLQHYPRMSGSVGAMDGGPEDAASFLKTMFEGMGDVCELQVREGCAAILRHSGVRIVRGLDGEERELLLACWIELWRGAVNSHRQFMAVDVRTDGESLLWTIRPE